MVTESFMSAGEGSMYPNRESGMLMMLESFGLWDTRWPGISHDAGCGNGVGLLMLMMMEGSGCGRPVGSC